MTAPNERLTTQLTILAGVLLLAYYSLFAPRDWIAHDEGLLGSLAREAAAGKLPHRDFEDPYTGGLSYYHAAVFAVLGDNLLSMRFALLATSALFLAAVYGVARQAVGALPAAGATLLVAVWSLPNYFAPLPSWYNAILALFGVLALLRFRTTGSLRWLIAAGLCAGLSILVKIVGLYFVAAGLLSLAFIERERRDDRETNDEGQTGSISWPLLFVKIIGAAAFTALLLLLVRRQAHPPEIVHFFLPGAALAWLLVWQESRERGGATSERVHWLAKHVGAFTLAALAPVALFAIPYLASGSLDALVNGVFITPQKRIDAVSMNLPPTFTLLAGIPLALLLACSLRRKPFSRAIDVTLAVLVAVPLLLLVLIAGAQDGRAYRLIWILVRPVAPLVAFFAVAWLVMRSTSPTPDVEPAEETPLNEPTTKAAKKAAKRQRLQAAYKSTDADVADSPIDSAELFTGRRADVYIVATAAALTSLVQYPYSHGIYFCYTTPLSFLAALFFVAATPGAPRLAWSATSGALVAFAVLWMNAGLAQRLGVEYFPRPAVALLEVPSGQIYVPESDAQMHMAIASLVQERSPAGTPIWAGPDCPEVAYLCDRPNAAAATYDVLAGVTDEDRAARIAKELDESGARIAIVLPRPEFSQPFSERSLKVFADRFPVSGRLGRFIVFAKE